MLALQKLAVFEVWLMVLFVCFFINLLVIFLSVVSRSAFFQSEQTPVLNKSKDKVEFNLL